MKPTARLNLLLGSVILIGLGWVAATTLSADDLRRAVASAPPTLVPAAMALGMLYTVIKAGNFAWLARPVADVASGLVIRAYLAAEAAVLLPGGVVMRVGLLNQLGVPVARGVVPVVVISLLDQVVLLGGTLVAALWLPEARPVVRVALVVLGVLVTLVLVAPVRRLLVRLVTALPGQGWRARWEGAADGLRATLTFRTLSVGITITVLAFVLKVAILGVCLTGFGWTVPPVTLLLAFLLPNLLGRLSPLPGGVGVTEAGMVAVLVSRASVPAEGALAAVVLFRAATVFFPALVGGILYFISWRRAGPAASLEH